jgi:hypothetical protein
MKMTYDAMLTEIWMLLTMIHCTGLKQETACRIAKHAKYILRIGINENARVYPFILLQAAHYRQNLEFQRRLLYIATGVRREQPLRRT